jgi:hypothetical protein
VPPVGAGAGPSLPPPQAASRAAVPAAANSARSVGIGVLFFSGMQILPSRRCRGRTHHA